MMLRGSSGSQQQTAVSCPLTAFERLLTKSSLEICGALDKVYLENKVNITAVHRLQQLLDRYDTSAVRLCEADNISREVSHDNLEAAVALLHRANKVELENNLLSFITLALGQVFQVLHGHTVPRLIIQHCDERALCYPVAICVQEFVQDMLELLKQKDDAKAVEVSEAIGETARRYEVESAHQQQSAAKALAEKQEKHEAELCATAAHLVAQHAVQRALQQEETQLVQQAALAAGNAAGQRCAANLMVRSAVQSSLHSEREGLLSEKIQHLESQLVRQVAAAERGAEEQRGKAEEQWYKVEERLSKSADKRLRQGVYATIVTTSAHPSQKIEKLEQENVSAVRQAAAAERQAAEQRRQAGDSESRLQGLLDAETQKVGTRERALELQKQEAQAEVLGLQLELGAAAEQNRKCAEDLQRVQAKLCDQTRRALLVEEEAACLKAELAEATAKSALTLEQRHQEAEQAAASLEVQVQEVKPQLAATLSTSSLPGQLVAEHTPCALQIEDADAAEVPTSRTQLEGPDINPTSQGTNILPSGSCSGRPVGVEDDDVEMCSTTELTQPVSDFHQAQQSPVSPDAIGSSAAEVLRPVSAPEINPQPQPSMVEGRMSLGGSTPEALLGQGTKAAVQCAEDVTVPDVQEQLQEEEALVNGASSLPKGEELAIPSTTVPLAAASADSAVRHAHASPAPHHDAAAEGPSAPVAAQEVLSHAAAVEAQSAATASSEVEAQSAATASSEVGTAAKGKTSAQVVHITAAAGRPSSTEQPANPSPVTAKARFSLKETAQGDSGIAAELPSGSPVAGTTGPSAAVGTAAGVPPVAAPQAADKADVKSSEWVACPYVPWVEWPRDPNQRSRSSGGTAVVYRARARSEADLEGVQLPADIKPGQQLVIKQVTGAHKDMLRQLTQHEEEVLKSLSDKAYVPTCYGLYDSTEAGSGDLPYCGNLVIGLVQGHTLQAVIEAVQKRVRKHRRHPDKLAEVQKWLWSYARHVAHGLAQVLADLHQHRSHRDLKPQNIMVAEKRGKVSVTLIDFAGSRLNDENERVNSGFTPGHASPQLVQFLGGLMQPMLDEPNDMWAVGTVLFQLLISAYPPWDSKVGPFMFGPTDKDMVESSKISDRQEWATFTRGKIQAGHELWATSASFNRDSLKHPTQVLELLEAAKGLPDHMTGHPDKFLCLLEGLLHPQVDCRMTAAQMRMLPWLQAASMGVLCKSPIRL